MGFAIPGLGRTPGRHGAAAMAGCGAAASMARRPFGPTAAAAAAVLVAPVLLSAGTPASRERARLAEAYGQVPLAFEANVGQTDPRVAFLARGTGYALFLTPGEAVLSLRRSPPSERPANPTRDQMSESLPPAVLRLKCRGANPSPRVSGIAPQPARSNYFIGSDPSRWRTDVPHFDKVRYEGVYPGIDLVYYGRQRQLEFDFVVQPEADPRKIRLDFEGADTIETDAQGDLIVRIGGGALRQHKPIAYQERDGRRQPVAAAYVVESQRRAAFRLGAYDPSRRLVIDPVLVYSTYHGGGGRDEGHGIAVDSAGSAYVTGFTASTDFATANPIQGVFAGGALDVFVTKLNAAGSALVYSTYLGGSNDDAGYGIAVDGAGDAYVTGWTRSTNFPTANPIQAANAGISDIFVAKLNAVGSALVYSTYLGGSGTDLVESHGIGVDGAGNAYVTGHTWSTNFPTVNPIQGANAGISDVFVAKLNAAGSAVLYSTYLGGGSWDYARGIVVDGSAQAHIAGDTGSTNFPTANPIQGVYAGGYDAFVATLNAAGSALVYSTYLGGSGVEYGTGIAVDGSDCTYVTGETNSTNFPTASPIQGTNAGGRDAFVAKLNAAGSALVYSTYLGGSSVDAGRGIAVDDSGQAYVTGLTSSTGFPIVNPVQAVYAGSSDVFVTSLNAAGSALVYSTYLGGSGGDYGYGIALEISGNAYVTGVTSSPNFPTASPIQGANAGGLSDAFLAKIGGDVIFKDGFEGP